MSNTFKAGDRVKNHVGRPGSVAYAYKDCAWVLFDNAGDVPQTYHHSNLTKLSFEVGKKYHLGSSTTYVYEVVYVNDKIAIFLTTQHTGHQIGTWDSHEFFGNYTEVAA